MQDCVSDEIVRLCLGIEENASAFYKGLSLRSRDSGLGDFWAGMSAEATQNARFFGDILGMEGDGLVRKVFDDPDLVCRDLTDILHKTRDILEHNSQLNRVVDAFILAYRIELAMVHPAFERLYHFTRGLSLANGDSEARYASHINKLIEACKAHGAKTPELELLGESIQKLWNENRDLALRGDLDSLTGVYNRRGLLRMLRTLAFLAERTGDNACVLMIDIDNFKSINDTHGHHKGDEALVLVARILQNHVRASDVIGRYGGEEFIAYLSRVSAESSLGLADSLREAVQLESRALIPLTISIGLAQGGFERNVDATLDALIRQADDALYQAKRTGKNKVVFK